MVRVAGKSCVLDAGEGRKSPPLPFIEVDEATARALIGTGVAVLVDESEAVAAEWAKSEADAREAAQAELAAYVAGQAEPESEGGPASEPEETVTTDSVPVTSVDGDRRQTIIEAFDLLEPEHFVAIGARKGRPKLNAVEDISGIRDLTVAEIDELFAARSAED